MILMNCLIISIILFVLIFIILIYSCIKKYNNFENYENSIKNVYILRAYLTNEQTLKAWDKFLQDLPNERCFILYDNTQNSMDINSDFYHKYKQNIILQKENDSKKINKLHHAIKTTPEACIINASKYISTKIDFDYLWVIEEDIYVDGSLKEILDISNNDNSDLLARDLDSYTNNKDWNNWNNLFGEYKNLPLEKQIKGFYPIVRMSKNYLKVMENNLGISSGFFEIYSGTLALNNNLTYNNFPDQMFGKFVAHKVIDLDNLPNNKNNKLYHKFVYESKNLNKE